MSESERLDIPDGTVILVGNHKRTHHIYHTTQCHIVEQAAPGVIRQRDRDRLAEKWRECRYCSGESNSKSTRPLEYDCPICHESGEGRLTAHIRAEHNAGGVGDD